MIIKNINKAAQTIYNSQRHGSANYIIVSPETFDSVERVRKRNVRTNKLRKILNAQLKKK